jgi:Ca2+-binding EF-hand superfamily protein
MSQAPSRVSATRSEVSQVDFKFKSNDIKKKLKSLLKNLDTDKTGMLKHEVFFELLALHRIDLSNDAKNYLKKHYSKNQTINYKEAINQITIDLNAAGGNDEEEGVMKWTVFAL